MNAACRCVDVGDPAKGFGRTEQSGHAEEVTAGLHGANVVHPASLLFGAVPTLVACGPESREPQLPPAISGCKHNPHEVWSFSQGGLRMNNTQAAPRLFGF